MRTTLVAYGISLLVLAGCGGGDDKKETSSPTTVAAQPGGPSTTLRPVNTSFTGQGSAQFCNLARTYNERFTSVGGNPSPAQLRAVSREGQTAITQAVNTAPPEIKRDVEVLATTFSTLIAELEKVNFEVNRLQPSALGALSAPEFTQATTRFQAYIKAVCGVG